MQRTVVITGGTAGIGLASAEAFARKGWKVAILARDEGRLRQTEERLRQLGVQALGIATDMADPAAVEAAADRIERDLGPIDAWVNNAMATVVAPAGEITPEEFKRVTEVTYNGQVYGTLAALKHMRRRRRGSIVQVNSVLGIRPFPLQSAYAGAKAAALGWTNALRAELDFEGVPVTLSTIFLPAVNTPQFAGWARNKTGRRQIAPDPVYDPRLAANAIVFAAEHPRRDVWVGRTTFMASILQRIWPNAGDHVAKGGWEGQLSDETIPRIEGNLFTPAKGSAVIDGPFKSRTLSSRHTFVTSRQRDIAVLGGATLLAAGIAHLLARRTGL
ncbi:short-chain dehydrogenase [Aureimonas sp. Leaf454]|uniref:SDR family oxidoreductase n=1 Tax=Aureimonas sp. Leaf454 TaxID=1736381 RepID=UPI0006F1FEBA|nr:SDR family oxidoreductase [Aureimonas sp. Leaf454]KQT54567.1 short-chain dehydrogenase [Aureimonas sp. Leaf454]